MIDDFKEPKKINKQLLNTILAAALGSVITLISIPILTKTGFISSSNLLGSPSSTIESKSFKISSDITEAVKKAQPAVVGIISYKSKDDSFSLESVQQGSGSGIIIEKANGKAKVVTNNHVVKGSAKVSIVLPDTANNKTVSAKILGTDEISDLAVLEIDGADVTTVAELGNSDTLQAGEPAIAIGNPLGLGQSVSVGVISSPKRTTQDKNQSFTTDVIQTDAAINPGNSGGALLNKAGQVIGINTAKISGNGLEGLGFAIPSNEARPIINSLSINGEVPRPMMGISTVDLEQLTDNVWAFLNIPSSVKGGVVIKEVAPGSPAEKAGLKPKDIIVAIDNHTITSISELRKYIFKNKKIGDSVSISFYREGKKDTKALTLIKANKEN